MTFKKIIFVKFGVNVVILIWGMLPWKPFSQNTSNEKIFVKRICGIIVTLTETIACFLLSCMDWLVLFYSHMGERANFPFKMFYIKNLKSIIFWITLPKKLMTSLTFFCSQLIPNIELQLWKFSKKLVEYLKKMFTPLPAIFNT